MDDRNNDVTLLPQASGVRRQAWYGVPHLRSERSRLRREPPKKRTNAGRVWGDNSKAYPGELRTASRRVGILERRGLDHEELCEALAVYARIPDLSGEPHHAIGFTEYVARTFIAKLREEKRERERADERAAPAPSRGLHRPDFSAVLRGVGL